MERFTDIQRKVIQAYGIKINEHSTCSGRMHAHVKTRTICKWKPKNSFKATFDLLHEIGHIMTTTATMRRAEEEYYATVWAIDECRRQGLEVPFKVPDSILFAYQRYIITEMARGMRRGGRGYDDLNLYKYIGQNVTLNDLYVMCDDRWKAFIGEFHY